MKKSFLFVGVGAAILLYILSKKSAAKNLRVYFQTISLKKGKGLNFPTVQAVFRIVNPTSSALTIDSIAGDILLNGQLLSSLSQTDSLSIPGQSESIYTVNIKTPIFNALTTLISLFKNKTKKINVEFTGSVNSGGIIIPISQKVNVV
jgi:LEA14-like dessication related protein